MSENYYDELGVSKDASQQDIKNAYRKLALKYHPDHNKDDKGAEDRFKKIASAYDTLSDERKRSEYDQPHMQNINDIFRGNFGGFPGGFPGGFGGFNMGGRPRGAVNRNVPRKGRDLKWVSDEPLYKFILGGSGSINVKYEDVCTECNGKGATKTDKCPNCGGSGMVIEVQRRGNMHMQTQMPCPICGGKGERVLERCKKCSGKGSIAVDRDISYEIMPGVSDGNVLCVGGDGGKGVYGGPMGDLYIKLRMILPKAESLSEEQIEVLKSL